WLPHPPSFSPATFDIVDNQRNIQLRREQPRTALQWHTSFPRRRPYSSSRLRLAPETTWHRKPPRRLVAEAWRPGDASGQSKASCSPGRVVPVDYVGPVLEPPAVRAPTIQPGNSGN